jgi:hypothetical protein
VPDCTLARELVGFAPSRNLAGIIGAVIDDQAAGRTSRAAVTR